MAKSKTKIGRAAGAAKGRATIAKKAAVKLRLWVEAMITNGGNATHAAIAAGYKPGRAAEKAGERLSKNVEAVAFLARRRKEVYDAAQEKTGLTVERTLQEIANIAYFQPKRLFKPDGTRIPVHELPDDVAAAVASIEQDELTAGRGENAAVIGENVKLKVWDKNSALDKAMRHFGQYKKDNEQKPVIPVPEGVAVGKLTVTMDFKKVKAGAKAASRRA